jgi:hypothetical protein
VLFPKPFKVGSAAQTEIKNQAKFVSSSMSLLGLSVADDSGSACESDPPVQTAARFASP